MKRLAVVFIAAGIAASFASPRAGAQVTPNVTLTFIQPTDVDPPNLTFHFAGETRTTDDFGNLVTGAYLLDSHNTFPQPGPGIDLHGQISGPGGFQNITEVDISFDFNGNVNVVPTSKFGFDPWTAQIFSDGAFHTIKLTDPGAPINDAFHPNPQNPTFPSFAHFGVSDLTDPNGTFGGAIFSFQALAVTPPVPEPGVLSLAGSLAAVGGWALLRRRREA